ncbi:hypothetical protein [Leifsonia sp. Leaf264]|uniref:hypothetical protein n=1 Tax=Leifsonia sp. Leaf264 TaxID=1736314 RepID=UPI0006FF3E7B|nr:hypothetical protein [Leifsonia sp. Leaf264]KQO98484.1 hypothetical protein ASF30_10505 [Leifsonia sp. Leaf264]
MADEDDDGPEAFILGAPPHMPDAVWESALDVAFGLEGAAVAEDGEDAANWGLDAGDPFTDDDTDYDSPDEPGGVEIFQVDVDDPSEHSDQNGFDDD